MLDAVELRQGHWPHPPRHLSEEEPRIWKSASVLVVMDRVYLQIEQPGLHLNLNLTIAEIDELTACLQTARDRVATRQQQPEPR